MIILKNPTTCCGSRILVFIAKYGKYCCPCLDTKLTKEQAEERETINVCVVNLPTIREGEDYMDERCILSPEEMDAHIKQTKGEKE